MTKSSEYMIIGLLWLILADVGSQGWVRVLAYTLAAGNIALSIVAHFKEHNERLATASELAANGIERRA